MKPITLAALVLLPFASLVPLHAELEIKDTEGEHLDVLADGKVLVRYMYKHDTSSKESRHETYKPYLHVFNAKGSRPITKGAGGQFTHHRGIFLGWNRIQFDGKRYDRWHMNNGDIVHRKFLEQSSEGHNASFTSMTQWLDENGEPFLDEARTMAVTIPEDGPGRLVIDFQSKLSAKYGDVVLNGDPEHAGIQYRPANEVEKKETVYTFPESVTDVRKERDLPWIAQTYSLDGETHSVVQMNHPSNPKETRHSAYRDYGRFGSFFEKEISEGESLTVNYRFLIFDGKLPDRDVIGKAYEQYTSGE